jgi:hypothetical protein
VLGATHPEEVSPAQYLVFAELKDPVGRKIERYGLTATIDPCHSFPAIESALTAFRRKRAPS